MNEPLPDDDEVLRHRAALARWAALGKRVGYSLYGLAIVLFIIGFATSYRTWMTTTIIAAMAIGGIILVPAIVLAYGIKAAEREERGETSHY